MNAMTQQVLPWTETTEQPAYPSFRLHRNGEWIGTVWAHVTGFSWARIRIRGVGHVGDGCESIEDGKQKLLAYVEREQRAA